MNMEERKYGKAVITLIFLGLLILGISFIFPFLFLFVNSVKTDAEYYINPFALPGKWDFKNYISMVSQFKIFDYIFNTLFISAATIVIIIALAVVASYVFAKMQFKGRNFLYLAIIMTMFVPGQVTLIPLYVMYSKMGLISTPWSVIFAFVSGGLPSCIMLMTSYFRGLPGELVEAAKIDGCGFMKTIWRVVVPMGKPAIALNVIFIFLSSWNDVFTPLVLLTKREAQTIIVALNSLVSRYNGNPTFQMAGLTIACIPVIIIYLIFQKYLIKGMNVGAIK